MLKKLLKKLKKPKKKNKPLHSGSYILEPEENGDHWLVKNDTLVLRIDRVYVKPDEKQECLKWSADYCIIDNPDKYTKKQIMETLFKVVSDSFDYETHRKQYLESKEEKID